MGSMKDLLGDNPVPRYPMAPGWTEPTTSRAAAPTKEVAAAIRQRALAVIMARPSTADEVAVALGLSVLTVRPRIAELHADSKIERTGERRRNDSGASAAVWRVIK